MLRKLSRKVVVIVEALYLCIVKHSLPNHVQNALVHYMYYSDMCQYIYLDWLLNRWYPLYAHSIDHLPAPG